MRRLITGTSVLAVLISAFLAHAQSSLPAKSAEMQPGSLIMTFKDGTERRFPMSEIERIEFQIPPANISNAGQGRFLGEWRAGDCAGGHFKITLERGGAAKKTLGSPYGTWVVVEDEARITWDDGNRDTIRKRGDGYEKAWFAPGRSYSEGPSCTDSAESTDRKPI